MVTSKSSVRSPEPRVVVEAEVQFSMLGDSVIAAISEFGLEGRAYSSNVALHRLLAEFGFMVLGLRAEGRLARVLKHYSKKSSRPWWWQEDYRDAVPLDAMEAAYHPQVETAKDTRPEHIKGRSEIIRMAA